MAWPMTSQVSVGEVGSAAIFPELCSSLIYISLGCAFVLAALDQIQLLYWLDRSNLNNA